MTEVEAEVAVAKRARGAGAEAGGAGDDLDKLEIVLVCGTLVMQWLPSHLPNALSKSYQNYVK